MDPVVLTAVGLFNCAVVRCTAPVTPPPQIVQVDAAPADRWAGYISEAAQRFGLPEAWIRAVMVAESGGLATLDGRPTTSPAGAMGLMQLMPDTWTTMRDRYGLGPDPYDPHDNIIAATAFLRELYDRYGAPGFLAAYNAGPGRYDEHLATGRALPAETTGFAAAVALDATLPVRPERPSLADSGASLFFGTGAAATGLYSQSALFVPLHMH